MHTRPPTVADADRLGQIAEQAGLFPSDMMLDMLTPGLADGTDTWLVAEDETGPIGFAFARAEEMTDRVCNILALGIDPAAQGGGHGRALLASMERALSDCRLIIIETTQLPDQAAARALYASAGYAEVATVPAFYADGEDKIIFCKRVTSL